MCGLFRNFHSQGSVLAQAGAVGIGARPPEGEAAAPTVLAVCFAIEVGFLCGELEALKSCQRGLRGPSLLLPTASTSTRERLTAPIQGLTCQDTRGLFFYNIKGCFYDLEN